MKMVLASGNKGKIRELSALLNELNITLIPQAELGVADIEETGTTFVENALAKARHAANVTGLPAIADDSGLNVAALSGAPGIYSARYAGENANAKDNIQKLLMEMKNIPADNRQAFFYCVLVFMRSSDDPTPLICEGRWYGTILPAPQGEEGFGYDPVFYIPTLNKTAAQLPLAEKNTLSHRAKALKLLINYLREHNERAFC